MSNLRFLSCFGRRSLRNAFLRAAAFLVLLPVMPYAAPHAKAQAQTPAPTQAQEILIPRFWDPKRRPEKPNLGRMTTIRFLAEDDYPPFHFRGPNGLPILSLIHI